MINLHHTLNFAFPEKSVFDLCSKKSIGMMRTVCVTLVPFFLAFALSKQSFAQLAADVKIKKNTVIIDEVPAFEIFPDSDGNGFDLLTLKGDTLMKVRHRAYKNPDNYTPQNPTGQVDYYELIFPTLGNKTCELPYPMAPSKRVVVNEIVVANDVIWDNEVDDGAADIMVNTYGKDFSAARDTVVRKYGSKKIIIK